MLYGFAELGVERDSERQSVYWGDENCDTGRL
jgi:hypothetical protein